jgi:uncharacterized membrane protein
MNFFAHLRHESRWFLAIGGLAGLVVVAFVPPLSTFDAPSHFYRALQISRGHLRPVRYSDTQLGGRMPRGESRFAHTLWESYWIKHRFLTVSGWSALAREQPGDRERIREEFTNTAVYNPANYVPQALGMGLSRIFTPSPLWEHRAACAVNLLFYLALVTMVIETIPRFQAPVALLASTPMLLIQSATVSADGLNFAAPMLAFALTWRLWSEPGRGNRPELAAVPSLSVFTALLKPTNITCLGCLCFLPSARFGSRARRTAWLAATFAAALAAWLAWNRPYLDVNIGGWYIAGFPPVSAQKAWLFAHPWSFVHSLYSFLHISLPNQWGYGYSDVGGWIQDPTYAFVFRLGNLFLPVLLLNAACGAGRDWKWAGICLGQAAVLLVAIALTLWLTRGDPSVDYIPWLGGRYLFVFFAFVLAGWSSLTGFRFPAAGWCLFGLGLAMNVVGLAAILAPTVAMTAG